MLKRTFSGLQCCRRQYGSIFIRLAVVASQICEIPQISERIRPYTYSSSRSRTVIDHGVIRKNIYDFPLVINSNFGRISCCFRDTEV